MANSWSFLHDELNMSNQDSWQRREISMTDDSITEIINPGPGYPSHDRTNLGSHLPGGMGDDHITFNLDMNKDPNRYKYDEDKILKELQDYITGTYNQHYSAGDDKIQTLDLIEACGDGEAFCRSNILKYASRYDKKGTARRDIMKILHYAVLLMHFNDKNAKRETYPQ